MQRENGECEEVRGVRVLVAIREREEFGVGAVRKRWDEREREVREIEEPDL